jgi:hypothetical protein
MQMVIIRSYFYSYRLSNKSYWVDPFSHLTTLFFVGPTICLAFWRLQSSGQPFDVWPLYRPPQKLLFLETTCHFLKVYVSNDFGATSSPNTYKVSIIRNTIFVNCNSRNHQDNNAKATNETPIIRMRMSSFLLY